METPPSSNYPKIVELLTTDGRGLWKKLPAIIAIELVFFGSTAFFIERSTFHGSGLITVFFGSVIVLFQSWPSISRSIFPDKAWKNFIWRLASFTEMPIQEALLSLESELAKKIDSFGDLGKLTESWLIMVNRQVSAIPLSRVTSISSENEGSSLEQSLYKRSAAYQPLNYASYNYKISLVANGRPWAFEFNREGQRDASLKLLLKRLPNLVSDGDGTWSIPSSS